MYIQMRLSQSLSIIQNCSDSNRWAIPPRSLRAVKIWNEEINTMDVMVEGSKANQVAGLLHEREISFATAIADVVTLLHQQLYGQLKQPKLKPESRSLTRSKSKEKRAAQGKAGLQHSRSREKPGEGRSGLHSSGSISPERLVKGKTGLQHSRSKERPVEGRSGLQSSGSISPERLVQGHSGLQSRGSISPERLVQGRSSTQRCKSAGTPTQASSRQSASSREQCSQVSLEMNDEGPIEEMCWKRYHRLNTIYSFLYKLAEDHPKICSVHVIGRSVEGRDLVMLKISNGNPNNEGVWMDGAIHPREWISVAVVTYITNTLVKSFKSFKRNVTNKDWFILPVMNPDGYEYTFTHDRMWRKNRAHGHCIGVDLNRNFSCGWGEQGEEGSSEDQGSVFYRGHSPFSEPETLCVRHQILDCTTKFKVFLSFHSYGEVIIFPWGYSVDPCPDYVELLEGGTAFAKGIFENSGQTYRVGSTKDLMYFSSGTSIDWGYGVAGIPFCYMIELRSKKTKFLLPPEEILPTATEVFSGLMKFLEFVDKSPLKTSSCVSSKL